MTHEDLVARRHAELLAELETPAIPAELSSRAFLDGIYERAAQQMADSLEPEVAETLSEQIEAPAECSEPLVDRDFDATPLRNLEPVEAPGLVWPRLRADLQSWKTARLRYRMQRRIGSGLAAAALVFLAVWTFDGFAEGEVLPDPEPRISIVRHRVSSPFAPGFSSSAIVREIAGDQGVLAAPPSAPDFPTNRVGGRRAR